MYLRFCRDELIRPSQFDSSLARKSNLALFAVQLALTISHNV